MRTSALRRPLIVAALVGAVVLSACGGGSSTSVTTVLATTLPATTVPATTAPATTAPASTAPATATVKGTAYTFNTPDPIAGATIKVEELPSVSATTAKDGSYELDVPVGATITPYIEAKGHHSIRLQTFTVDAAHDGTALEGVNFQTPSDGIYDGLKVLVKGFTGKDPFAGGCVVVTTVGDKKMIGMSFDRFINFHPHGVAGVAAHMDPAKATAIYFNDQVLPDKAQHTTSVDGGVLWPNVPPGNYTLTATKTGMTFATVHVTCQNGWVVNANPVWGLHQLP